MTCFTLRYIQFSNAAVKNSGGSVKLSKADIHGPKHQGPSTAGMDDRGVVRAENFSQVQHFTSMGGFGPQPNTKLLPAVVTLTVKMNSIN